MFELRPLSPAAIPAALAKAERYRLLNDSGQAESICQDVLAIDPDNQDALAMMILAITDQFNDEGTASARRARRTAGAGLARRLHPGLLRRDHQRAPRARGAGRRSRDDGLRVAARRPARLRPRHRPAARRQRRRGAALERVRAGASAPSGALARRSRRVRDHVGVNDDHSHAERLRAARSGEIFKDPRIREFRDFLARNCSSRLRPKASAGVQVMTGANTPDTRRLHHSGTARDTGRVAAGR